jgi:hypothetical protein
MTMQPAAFMRSTMRPSNAGTWSANKGEPKVVTIPAVSAMSLMACGMPCIQPMLRPAASWVSRASAWRSSASPSCRLTIALKTGFTAAIRAR